jgi:uroporphyrinogen-III synthase
VAALGGRVVGLPGMSLRGPQDAGRVRAALRATRGLDAWVFTSPAAVRFAFALVPGLRIPRRARVFAVGQGTARALARHAHAAIAPRERQDADGLLALDALAAIRGRRVALVTAPGGRDVIGPELERRGAQLHTVHVYRRVPPRLDRRHFRALEDAASPLFTLLSSALALDNLAAALPRDALARLRHETAVVSSARLRSAVQRHGFRNIVLARSALGADLLEASAAALARHRL